jgi:CHAT domain-containing protein
MMLPALLLAAFLAVADEPPRLVPGQRLEGVERARLEVAEAGPYTLARSNGALVLGEQRSDTGWLVAELAAGAHEVVLPGGPGDVTAFAGAVEEASCATFLNRAIAQLNAGDLPAAGTSLLACRARPGQEAHHALARMFTGSLLQREERDLASARELLQGSREAVAGFGPDLVAYAEDSLGQVALALGEWGEAQRCFERVREVATDAGIKAMATSGLAQAAAGLHDHDAARRLHEEALVALGPGSEPSYVSIVASRAGRWHQSRAEFARAAELLAQAAANAPGWFGQVEALGQLGTVELMRGSYGAALSLMDRAAALAALHAPSPHDAKLLRNRAALAFGLGEYGVARESLEGLLDLLEDAGERATVRADLGLIAHMLDDDDVAEHSYGEAVASSTGRPRWYVLNGMVVLLHDRGITGRSEPLAREALQIAEDLDDPYLVAISLIGLSEASCRAGKLEAALDQAEASVAAVTAQDARDLLLPAWHGVARAALLLGDEAKVEGLLALAWEEAGRADIATLPALEAAQVRSRVSELSDWGEVAADLAACRASRGRDVLAADLGRVTGWKSRTLLSRLDEDAPDDIWPALALLLDGRTLVEYAAGHERLYAFVAQTDDLRLIDLGLRRPIEDMVQEFLGGLQDQDRLIGAGELAHLGRKLHVALVAPLGLSDGAVTIVPSGDLARLPFEALVVDAPEDVRRIDQLQFVLDHMDVAYAPSSAVLVALASRPAAACDGPALLLGDPTYAAEREPELLAARGAPARRWDRLPQSRDELTRIARLLLTQQDDERARDDLLRLAQMENARDVAFSSPDCELRLGREASVEALRSLAPSARLIHVAAHADVDRWDAHRTGLMLAWDEAGQGLFSLADIAGLELDADLVVLSACRTADGRLLNGEGVQSMAGAFLAAGARGVVATLWPVQDAQAQDLMESFAAAHLAGGETPARSLRLAKRDLRRGVTVRGISVNSEHPDRQLGHPHYWASFIYTGAFPAARR